MADIVTIDPVFIGSPEIGIDTYQMPSETMIAVGDIINATWNKGLETKAEFSAKIDEAMAGFLDLTETPHVTPGTVAVPTVTAPDITITDANPDNVFDKFSTEYIELATWLDGKFTAFRAAYFPDESALYMAAEDSLQAALASDSYLPAAAQQNIWGDDHARITSDKLRAQDAAIAQFAARRFPLPPDVAASAVMQIEQKAQDELAESSRKIAVMSVEQYRYVIDSALKLRSAAMSAAVEYIKSLASAPEMASRLVNVGYDAQSKLISAAASFYNADTQAKDMVSKVLQYNNSITFDGAVKNQTVDMQMVENKLKALLGEAQSIAQMATAFLNNLNVSASISAQGGVAGTVVSN